MLHKIKLTATIAVVAAIAAAGTAQAKPHCRVGNRFVSDSYAVVYGKSYSSVLVCVKATGQKIPLIGATQGDQYALSGQWLAFSTTVNGDNPNDPKSPQVVDELHLPDQSTPAGLPFSTQNRVDTIIVKPDGAVAFSASNFLWGTLVQNQPPKMLFDGTQPGSLTNLAGSTVAWTDNEGAPATATLY